MKYKAAIFDMDGTILDTIEDMRDSFCYILKQNGYQADYSSDQVKYFFGSGIQIALVRAMAVENGMSLSDTLHITKVPDEQKPHIQKLAQVWSAYYAQHCTTHTKPFPQMLELLDTLNKHHIQTAVVSNKPDLAVQKLAENYFLGKFSYIIGEQKTIRRKPHPDMLLETLKQMNLAVEECVYIGDSEVDIETAGNAGCDVIAVTWGFRTKGYLQTKNPDCIVESMEELRNEILK